MDESHNRVSLAESDGYSDTAQDEALSHKRRVTGAVKRRIKWWIRQGKSAKEAEELALKPCTDIPEYIEIKNVKDAKVAKKKRKSAKFKQLKVLRTCVINSIHQIGAQGGGQHFCGCYSRCGIFIIKCADEHTIKWVTAIFPTLEPWEQAKLVLLNECESKSEISMFFRRKQSKEDRQITASDKSNFSDHERSE